MCTGYLDIIRNVYKVCCRKLQHGGKNEIFIFGFSRGACKSNSTPLPGFVFYSLTPGIGDGGDGIIADINSSYFSGPGIVSAVCRIDQGRVFG